MNAKVKNILNIVLKVASWLLIAFTVFMMIFTVVTVSTVDRNERDIFGYKFFIVTSNSMSLSENNKDMDVHFDAGDIIIAKNVEDPTKFQPDDIITFWALKSDSDDGTNGGFKTVTHMIRRVEKNSEGKVIGYKTFGTNTGDEDDELVLPEDIIGSYAGKLPIIGHFFAFVKSTPGYITCILVPFLLLILYYGVNVIILFRKYKGEQLALVQAEKDKLDAERAETQRMMQELLALKAQLEKNGADQSKSDEN